MTVYDDYPSSDGYGGPHPLAGVPQAILDAVTLELENCFWDFGVEPGGRQMDRESLESIAHSILQTAIVTAEGLQKEDE